MPSDKGNMIYICGISFKRDTPEEVIDYIRNNISSMRGKAGFCANYLILPNKKYQPGGKNPFNLYIAYQEPRQQTQQQSFRAPPSSAPNEAPPPTDDDCPI